MWAKKKFNINSFRLSSMLLRYRARVQARAKLLYEPDWELSSARERRVKQ